LERAAETPNGSAKRHCGIAPLDFATATGHVPFTIFTRDCARRVQASIASL
jgi:hypothetical protein